MDVLYQNKNITLSIAVKFVYEVSIYKVYKDRVEILETKFLGSDKEIKDYKQCVIKIVDDFKLIKYTEFIAAPIEYLNENNFKQINDVGTKKRKKSK